MKRTLSIIAILTLALGAVAQTNFRHISFADAMKAAKAEKKLVFVDFYTSWCGPCKMMARDVFPQQKVGEFMNARFVCVKYDAEKEEPELVKKSDITAYPTFIIFDADGNEINRKTGGGSADAFIADIDRLSDNELTPEKIRARYDAGERTPRLIKAYAAMLNEEIYNSRRGREEKQQTLDSIINDYFNSLSEKEKLSKENFFIYTNYCSRTADEKMQFLFNNRDKAKKADRAEADTLLQKAYGNELQTMAAFYYPFDKAQYDLFRRQVVTFGFANTPENQGLIAVLDAYATGDLGKYIDAVEENAGEKCGEKSFSIYYGMATALKDAPKETKQRASKLIRSRLAGMTATDIAFIGRVLMDLETENKH